LSGSTAGFLTQLFIKELISDLRHFLALVHKFRVYLEQSGKHINPLASLIQLQISVHIHSQLKKWIIKSLGNRNLKITLCQVF